MTPEEDINYLLECIAHTNDFAMRSADLVDQWRSWNIGFEAVEPILKFMEGHPAIEFGTPGALVHFVETLYRSYKDDYEEKLLESVSRRPTLHTVWMLNRLINGTKMPSEKVRFVAAMAWAKKNPLADPVTLDEISRFLERLGVKGE
jgi:hypothetical protein